MEERINKELRNQKGRGVLLVLTGPTGAGKDTIFAQLMEQNPKIVKITTTSSRDKREGESEGNPYYFIPRSKFEQMIANGEFFEWVEFRGHLYGTQKQTLEKALKTGEDIIWHIDAKGIKNIKEKVKEMVDRSVFVFLTAPTVNTLKDRVKKDEEHLMHHRWNEPLVLWEMEQFDDCDYLVINEDGKLDQTLERVKAIIEAKRQEISHK